MVVGIVSGFGAWLFKKLTEVIYFSTILWPLDLLEQRGLLNFAWIVFLVTPLVCGLFVGFLVSKVSKEAKGHGIPEIIKSIVKKNGQMDLKVPFIKITASAFTIGSGGSAGREGPIAQIGAGFGSMIAQLLNLRPEEMKSIVIAGVAAGVSAVFNAPIGGVLFAIEVIKRETNVKDVSTMIIASVVGAVTGHLLWGNAFALSITILFTGYEFRYLPFCLILGLFAGLLSAAWIKIFYHLEDGQKFIYKKMKLKEWIHPAMGGLGVGIISFLTFLIFGKNWLSFTVMGITYLPMDDLLNGILPEGSFIFVIGALSLFFILKMLATGLSIGSGGSGGVFAPTLFLGVFLGSIFGVIVCQIFGFPTIAVALFALVGMASFFAGTVRAPFTAIIMTAEMTGNYFLTIPVMLGVVVGTLIAAKIQPEDIYLKKLARKGIEITRRLPSVLDEVTVQEFMIPCEKIPNIPINMILNDVLSVFSTNHIEILPITEKGILIGTVRKNNLIEQISSGNGEKKIADLITTNENCQIICIQPNSTAMQAAAILLFKNLDILPVVTFQVPQVPILVGWVDQSTFELAYRTKFPDLNPREIENSMVIIDSHLSFTH
ncbi:MAG: hypothetical protein E4G98_06860 [Promethearchaeota archaeon]|nr:MAG: hypothetical protein E4G98_06860 [Candidatus Lokiarchaeota archaeon]